jgi:hypothetical protein
MFHDSLIGSTISNISKNNVSCTSKISSPIVISHDTRISKVSEKDDLHVFYPKNFYHSLPPKPDFEDIGTTIRRNLKKIRIILVKNSIKSQTILVPL